MDNLIKIFSCETFWNDKNMKKHPSCRDYAHIESFTNVTKTKAEEVYPAELPTNKRKHRGYLECDHKKLRIK